MNHRAFIFRGALSLLLLCGNSVADFTAYTAALVKDLGSTNAQARIRARQLLPRHGAEAIEPLLPLLSSEDQGARLSAYNVIADIANVAASPGHEADRVLATTQLMKLVAADATESQKLQGMRLLTIVVPDGFDVSPIAALLKSDNANMREKARESLTLIATNEACDALISAAGNTDAAFAAALLDSVAMLRNPIALDRAAALAEHNDPLVRCAAMRAIAWRGNPEYLQIADSVIARATPETLFFANDAKLRLADAMALHGGNWDAAMQVYKDVLAGATDPEIRGAAMMGLGRHGDATVVDEIVAAAASANGALDSQAAMALTSLRGREGIVAVAEAYPSLSESTRIAILSVWGQDKQEDAIDLVIREVTNTSPAIRFAALQALAAAGSMKGFPALVAVAKDGNAEEKAFALQTVRQMAGRLGGSGDAQAAGLAYVQLYGLS
ncbi:MAG TPA: hypothetical protein PLJ47_07660, partial [Candidatus Hydrogenedentes bacterium]|nr:hypothetical protein [Candidatus Hydrogenedentota bacterium]